MNDRERAKQLLDRIPDSKIVYVLAFLEGAAIPDANSRNAAEPEKCNPKMVAEAGEMNDM